MKIIMRVTRIKNGLASDLELIAISPVINVKIPFVTKELFSFDRKNESNAAQ